MYSRAQAAGKPSYWKCLAQVSATLRSCREPATNRVFVRLVHRYCGTIRLLQHVHVRRAACGLRGPALIVRPRRAGDLPVLVHVVSQRARVLRLRRTGSPLAINVVAVLPSSYSEWSRHPDLRAFRSSIAPPTDASVYASRDTSRCPQQDSRSGWIRYFLSCRALASPTTCRFIPALSELPLTWDQCQDASTIGYERRLFY